MQRHCAVSEGSWLDDIDWSCVEPRSRRGKSLESVLTELARELPAHIVEHTHFESREFRVGEPRVLETHDVHILLPVGRRALEFAYSVDYQK
mmetsp:Transcript_126362/g.236149  ORF Transcript_126362/g.236149 Transcript_126362/m.236149 type:complete len:92 (-) Transcript_126362:463-738(-)